MVKVDRYYDVGCGFCGRHLSTDFETGLFETRKQAEMRAKQIGFKTKNKKNICPECLKSSNSKNVDHLI